MKYENLKIGYDITLDKGHRLKPMSIHYWLNEAKFKKHPADKPLKYMADALLGLSLIQLNSYLKSPMWNKDSQYHFAHNAWKNLDPHFHLYERSVHRIESLQNYSITLDPKMINEFEKRFTDNLEAAQKPWGVDCQELIPLIEDIQWLESQLKNPIIYNFQVNFSESFYEKLHTFYSMLINLRSVIAYDYNAHVDDATFEALKVDSITDYIPRADYVVNDALLYWNFKKLSRPFQSTKSNNSVDKLLVAPIENSFHKLAHHATQLINQLPVSFLEAMKGVELEEALYLVQMDWLLGSPLGLVFRIREELYGIEKGYDEIFWPDTELNHKNQVTNLSLCCHISEHDIQKQAA